MIARGLTLFYTLYIALARILSLKLYYYYIIYYIAETILAEIFLVALQKRNTLRDEGVKMLGCGRLMVLCWRRCFAGEDVS